MTKSLTTIQQAVNTVRDYTHIDQTVPFITSVLETPISMLTKNELIDTGVVANAEECFELPPIKHLPYDISNNVLESIINEFKDVSTEAEEIRKVKSEELQKKLKLYNSIMERKCDEELIHSRRSRRREVGSGGGTPRAVTPARTDVSYTSPCLMNMSVYGNIEPQNDDLLEKQIEEKEKILAKMLNLDSLSIVTKAENKVFNDDAVVPTYKDHVPSEKIMTEVKPKIINKETTAVDLVPKIVKLPNNWNLENIELRLEMQSNGIKDAKNLISPDEHLDSDWEII
ncbi:hypothetical protein MSG28_011136 [Choristoneura fumiferana]|uniref:Uncharacterized protein n=2 Tax=Choristoneura fumiferana TaxID=7141 RepID=A0ACC0KQB9_CHOFU|nr:hypothetical protein MSG28_011136 [Choristoneura fumiferana]